jgi:hypothetical protein
MRKTHKATAVDNTTTIEIPRMISNIQNLQWWLDIVNIGIIAALALSFFFGGASFFINRKLNKAKDELASYEKRTSEERIALTQADAAMAHQKTQELEQQNLTLTGGVARA